MRLDAESNKLFKKCHLSFETVSAAPPYHEGEEFCPAPGKNFGEIAG
jgi:hypothetical protein